MSENGFFPEAYREFLDRRERAKGYEFQHAPSGSAPPPVVTFRDQLRWWTWDRWKRQKAIRQERDQRVQAIVQLRKRLDPKER